MYFYAYYRAFLLVPKDQIDPEMQIWIDVVRLKSLSMFPDKIVGIFRPFRQNHVVNTSLLVALR